MSEDSKGNWIDVAAADGGSFRAYKAVPPQGSGPGVVLLQEIFGVNAYLRRTADRLAEEGYVVLVPDLFWRLEPGVDLGYGEQDMRKAFELYGRFDDVTAVERDVASTIGALRAQPEHRGKVGCVGFCLGGRLAYMSAARTDVDCAVSYYGVGLEKLLDEAEHIRCPMVMHFGATDPLVPPEAYQAIAAHFAAREDVRIYLYPGVGHAFASTDRDTYDRSSTMMAYTRTLGLFRAVMGPVYDLERLWEEHVREEFETRDAARTMRTMVDDPYVNHVPTLTGGVGQRHLHRFYKYHFIPKTPKDTRLIPISRTIGVDRLIDEFIFCFTHDEEIDWMLPGLAPSGRYVEVPMVAVVNFRGDKLCHEHIYWDQASVLVQIGALDAAGLPVAGRESADKVQDEHRPSNTLMAAWASSEGKPL